jgi:hypothetical protein
VLLLTWFVLGLLDSFLILVDGAKGWAGDSPTPPNMIAALQPCTLSLAGQYVAQVAMSIGSSHGAQAAQQGNSTWHVSYTQLGCSNDTGATYQMVVRIGRLSVCDPTTATFALDASGTLMQDSIQVLQAPDCLDTAAVPALALLQILAGQAQAR